MAQDPGEFAIRVPIGADDQLTPQIERAERRFRSFRNFMRRETAAMRAQMATGYGGPFIGPQPAGRAWQRTGLQRASARYQRFQGGGAAGGLLPIAGSPAAQRQFSGFLRSTASSMRQLAPLTTRAFGAVNAATQTMMRGGAQAYLRAFGSIGVGGGLSRAFAPINAAGRAVGGGARMVGGIAGGVRGAFSPHNVFSTLAMGALAYGAGQAALVGPMQLAGQMEQAMITFDTLLGGAERASEMMEFLFRFAERTPLRFEPIRLWGQQLLQWGFAAERIPRLMNAIASSAAAMPEPEIAGAGITRALGQMRLRGRVLMEEINQLQDQGVPALEMLAKGYGVSTQEIIRWMETGARPAVLVGKQLRGAIDIITEGLETRYGGMLERQSKTLLGLWNTIVDTVQMRFILPWGQGLAAGVTPQLTALGKWLEENRGQVALVGEMFKAWGTTLSTAVAGKVREIVTGLASVFGSQEWKNARTFGEQWAVISGRVGELLWGNQQGQQGLVGQVMEWVKGATAGLLEWGQQRWTDFSNLIAGILQTWTTWTAERINEFKTEAFKRFGEMVAYFRGEFQSTIVSAIKAIIPWWNPPGGASGSGAGAAAGTAAARGFMGVVPGGAAVSAVLDLFLNRYPITSRHGVPNQVSFGGGPHRGIDVAAPAGTAILSPVAGTFGDPRALGLSQGYGRAVVVIDDQGNTHIFGHTAGGALGPLGGRVEMGQQIATVGNIANKLPGEISTGAHIHYEIRHMGDFNQQVDPEAYLTGLLRAPAAVPQPEAAATALETGGHISVDVGEVHVHTDPHEDPAAVNQAVADGFANALASSLEGAFANTPRVTR